MAKKARKKTAAKRRKSAKKAARRPLRKAAGRKAPVRRKKKRKAKGLVARVTSAFKTVVGSVEDTEKLRAKLEIKGSDETQ